MRSFVFAAGLFAIAALASPINKVARGTEADPCDDDAPPCMTFDQASVVANNFRDSIVQYSNATALEWFTADFTDYSSSVNTLINSGCTGPVDLTGPTFSSRTEFMAGQGGQPSIPFEILNLYHTCDTVVIRWRSAMSPEQVTGVIVIEAEYQKSSSNPWLIQTVYSEFNSGAWLVNLGVFTPSCTASKRSIESAPFFML